MSFFLVPGSLFRARSEFYLCSQRGTNSLNFPPFKSSLRPYDVAMVVHVDDRKTAQGSTWIAVLVRGSIHWRDIDPLMASDIEVL